MRSDIEVCDKGVRGQAAGMGCPDGAFSFIEGPSVRNVGGPCVHHRWVMAS